MLRAASITSALLLVASLALPTCVAHAQADGLTLVPDADLAPLAPRIAEGASRRLGLVVQAVDATEEPGELPPSSVRIASEDGQVTIEIVGGSGTAYRTTVTLASDEAANVRALVLSLAAVVDMASSDPGAPEPTHEDPPLLGPTDGSALRDLAPPFRPVDYTPHALFELRGRLGLGTSRSAALGGVGLTLGVAMGPYCVVLDADVLVPEEDHDFRGAVSSYVFVTTGLGGRFLPLRAGPVRGGVGASILLRTGHLWIDTQGVAETTFVAGGRFSIEGTVALGDAVAIALSGGVDLAFNPTKFVRATEIVFLEDVLVPWVALGLRFGG